MRTIGRANRSNLVFPTMPKACFEGLVNRWYTYVLRASHQRFLLWKGVDDDQAFGPEDGPEWPLHRRHHRVVTTREQQFRRTAIDRSVAGIVQEDTFGLVGTIRIDSLEQALLARGSRR